MMSYSELTIEMTRNTNGPVFQERPYRRPLTWRQPSGVVVQLVAIDGDGVNEWPQDKTDKVTCAPSEDWSAWASAESDQSLRHPRMNKPLVLSIEHTVKTLIRLRSAILLVSSCCGSNIVSAHFSLQHVSRQFCERTFIRHCFHAQPIKPGKLTKRSIQGAFMVKWLRILIRS